MALTDKEVREAKSREKDYKLYDGNGLVLRIRHTGGKSWSVKFRQKVDGKVVERALGLGTYPEVSLKEAREKNRQAQQLLADFKDPLAERDKQRRLAEFTTANAFQSVASEWFKKHSPVWSERYSKKLWRRIELHLFPSLGHRPIGDISPMEVLNAITPLEAQNKTETTHRLLQDCNGIFGHAIVTERCRYNPMAGLKGALRRHVTINMPTISDSDLPKFIEALGQVETPESVRLAIAFLMLTFVRTGEMRKSRKAHFDLKKALWEIDSSEMKMRRPHVVPLSDQAIKVLKRMMELSGENEFLLPNRHNRKNQVMSENTINKVIHKMGYKGKMVGHGFRALAATTLNKNGFDEKLVDLQLAHVARNRVSAAYNRYKYLDERTEMMQSWGDYLEARGLLVAIRLG